MARLEFQYIEFLDHEEEGIPNLERQIEEHPELFVHAIVFANRRSDGCNDPEGLRALAAFLGCFRVFQATTRRENLN
jgi:hypothetical protein